MKRLFLIAVLLVTPSILSGQSNSTESKDEARVRTKAKQFVSALMRTRDIRLLLKRWFLPRFELVADPEAEFPDTPQIIRKLPPKTRRRILIAQWNTLYSQLVIDQSKPEELECYQDSDECNDKHRLVLLRVLSPETVSRIIIRGGKGEAKTEVELLTQTAIMESVFDEVLPVLRKKDLEQTKRFQYWLKLFEGNRLLAYYVKRGSVDEDIRDDRGRLVAKKGNAIFGIETPLLLRIDFLKRGSQYKIFNISFGDGD